MVPSLRFGLQPSQQIVSNGHDEKKKNRGVLTGLPFPIYGRESHKSTAQNEDVGEWKGKPFPVDIEHIE
jgi:hypothetical protein